MIEGLTPASFLAITRSRSKTKDIRTTTKVAFALTIITALSACNSPFDALSQEAPVTPPVDSYTYPVYPFKSADVNTVIASGQLKRVSGNLAPPFSAPFPQGRNDLAQILRNNRRASGNVPGLLPLDRDAVYSELLHTYAHVICVGLSAMLVGQDSQYPYNYYVFPNDPGNLQKLGFKYSQEALQRKGKMNCRDSLLPNTPQHN